MVHEYIFFQKHLLLGPVILVFWHVRMCMLMQPFYGDQGKLVHVVVQVSTALPIADSQYSLQL